MNWVLLRNSLLVGIITTLLAVTLGFIAALWLAGVGRRLRTGTLAAAILALALPPFLVTNSWLHFLGRSGVWHSWLALNIFSLGGTVWILTLLLWPLSLLLVWGAWQRLEPEQLESDLLVCGGSLLRALLLPLAATALAQAAVLTFVLALNNFAVPAILQVKVFPAEMWIRFNTEFDTLGALRLSWPLVIGPLVLLIWFSRREVPWPHLQPVVSAKLFRQQLGPVWFWSSGGVTLLLCVFAVGLPLFQILSARRTWTELPGALAAGQSAVWNSLWYAGAAATVIMGISLWGAAFKTRRPKAEARKKAEGRNPNGLAGNRGVRGIHGNEKGEAASSAYSAVHNSEESLQVATQSPSARPFGFRPSAFFRPSTFGLRIFTSVAWLAFLLPGVLLGIGLIHAFNHDWSALFYQSAGIVILAYVIRYSVVGWHTASQAIRRVDEDLTDVALLEGANRWEMLRYVQWPQIARSMFMVWYIIFLLCLWDVESMILVVPPGGETLALRIFNLLHYGHNSQVNALCFVLLGVALVPLVAGPAAQRAYGALLKVWTKSGRATGYSAGTAPHAVRNTLLTVIAPLLLLLTSCSPASNQANLHGQIFASAQVIGTRGVGVGQFNKPRSVAVDAQDNVYAVDTTGRVQKFSSNGVFLLSWQMPEIERGKPKGMGHDRQGNILLVEPHYSRVNLFSPLGRLLAQWGGHGTDAGQFSMPRAVAVNSRGEIFVSEYEEIERIQKFAFDSDSHPTAGTKVQSLRPPPRWLATIGHAGTGPGEFNRAEGLCVDARDRLYVADSCNHRIQVFSSDGKFLRAYGKPGEGPGELSYPYDICVDPEGRQYVCEFGNSRIQVFDAHDRPLEIIGGPGFEPGRFSNPWAVALDSAGNLYVADSQNHRLQKLVRRQ